MKKKKAMSRSENMARIKGKDTKPEVYLRKLLWHKGYRYRCNYRDLKGKPDIYIKKYNTAIFVNGCFWHMHKGCSNSNIPKSNREFWLKKLNRNVERDYENYQALEKFGIKTVVVWECTLKKMKKDNDFEKEICDRVISVLLDNNSKLFVEI